MLGNPVCRHTHLNVVVSLRFCENCGAARPGTGVEAPMAAVAPLEALPAADEVDVDDLPTYDDAARPMEEKPE